MENRTFGEIEESDVFVIKSAYGGLGDHLFYSHLPRIAKESGRYRRVFVSSRSDFRHADYRRLIWEANPFIDGFTDQDAPSADLGAVDPGKNILDQIMLFRGLDDGRRFHEPEIYFDPAADPLVSNAIVYDPNFVSFVGGITADDVDRYFAEHSIVPDFMLKPREKSVPASRFGAMLETSSFEHYCSIIRSAALFICLTSGGATLAAALGKPAVALWGSGQNPIFHHSRMHTYVNVHPNFGERNFPGATRAARNLYLQTKAAVRRYLPSRVVRR